MKVFLFAVLLVFAYPALAQEAAQEQPEEPEIPPHVSLIAPFDYSGGEVKELDFAGRKTPVPVIETDMRKAHRNKAEIGKWVMQKTAELLTYKELEYKTEITKNKSFFTENGYQKYLEFLRNEGLLKALDGGRYMLRTFVQEIPVFLNEGAVDGHYRWLYEVNVMLTIFERTADGYNQGQPTNRRYTVTMQVGRSENAPDDQGILIERWDARTRKP